MNRSYKAGRHLLNAGEVQARILEKWAHSVVQVVDLQGLDLRHQIALFQQTSILIWTHGAAMADLLFLPQVQQASNLAAKHVILETGSSISIPCASLSACRASSCGAALVPAWACLYSMLATIESATQTCTAIRHGYAVQQADACRMMVYMCVVAGSCCHRADPMAACRAGT